jgi:hypothetical protein
VAVVGFVAAIELFFEVADASEVRSRLSNELLITSSESRLK